MERPGVLSYHYLLFMPAFMPAASVFVLSIIIVSPKEHPGLGAASARRQRAFLRVRWQDGGDGRGERRRLWRVELGAGRRGVGGGVELGLGGGRGLHHRGHRGEPHRGHLRGWGVRLRVGVRVSGLRVGDIVFAHTGVGDVERIVYGRRPRAYVVSRW